MTGGKPKAKDQSSNKFLQRIAGKKALAPPPTPRPVIGEHPVRTLLRENADVSEVDGQLPNEAAVREEASATGVVASPPAGQQEPAQRMVDSFDVLAAGAAEQPSPKVAAPVVAPKADEGNTSPAGAEEKILGIKKKYRLNSGEFTLYRELYLMTHASGKTECSFVVSDLVKATGMLERRVRDNLRRLKKNGWLVLVEAYDFENREKAKYRVNLEPRL